LRNSEMKSDEQEIANLKRQLRKRQPRNITGVAQN
jgi:hypothetical protein